MRTRNGRRKVLFGTNYPMIFHEPALADLDALAFGDEARELYLSANAQRLFEGGRVACFASASGSEPGGGSGARNGRDAQLRLGARSAPSLARRSGSTAVPAPASNRYCCSPAAKQEHRPVTATLSGLVLSTRRPGHGRGCGSCPSWRMLATVRSPTGQAFRR
jgi:hypothetical protein